ncbi:hypothetical protein Tco_0838179 [Tanacetum coccineum]|uniref:Uncharacterized protein n=1 Tax=Tanacetum coccineum TaxID=301880 RepID=A0ABQ5AQE1_9ASTR
MLVVIWCSVLTYLLPTAAIDLPGSRRKDWVSTFVDLLRIIHLSSSLQLPHDEDCLDHGLRLKTFLSCLFSSRSRVLRREQACKKVLLLESSTLVYREDSFFCSRQIQSVLSVKPRSRGWFRNSGGLLTDSTYVLSGVVVAGNINQRYRLALGSEYEMLFFDVATSFDSAVHRVHAVSFDVAVLDVASTVSAACIVAAGYIVIAGWISCDAASSYSFLLEDLEAVPADYVPGVRLTVYLYTAVFSYLV